MTFDAAYDRLNDATVIELSWLYPRWSLRDSDRAGCDSESLVLRSADQPHAADYSRGEAVSRAAGYYRGQRFMAVAGAKRMKL